MITNSSHFVSQFRTISCPIDGRLNSKQAFVIVLFTWFWSIPFVVLPVLQIWGKFTTGKFQFYYFTIFHRKTILSMIIFLEGFLTTCSFDFLTEDDDTKVFVGAIFIWSYCIPMFLIIFFYSQLLKSVKAHEKMLKDQVFINLIINI